jgi:uncharacterized membrane protein YbhN (UPF0104 family)
LSRVNGAWIALTLGVLAMQVAFVALRWRTIAAICGAPLGFGAALQISFIAMFFNQVLPSTVGGDAARIWLLARKGSGWASATYSVLIDRIAGVVVLAIIVMACLPWTLALIGDGVARAVMMLIGVGAVAGALVFLAIGFAPRAWFDRFLPARHLAEASRTAWRLCRTPRSAALVGICSLAVHALTVTAAWSCMKAVAAPVGFAPLLFLLPPVLLIATLPISIAGWGVRESSMVVAFAYAGLAQSDGLTLSVMYGAASFIVGVAGGLVWIASGLKVRPPDKMTEQAMADARQG